MKTNNDSKANERVENLDAQGYANIEGVKIQESGYSMIIKIIREVVPTVRTIGFVSAENPMVEAEVKKYEKDAKTKFKNHLKDACYGHTEVLGKYGTLKNPYFIPNILKEDLITIGNTYNQATVIYGEKVEDGLYEGFKFQLISAYGTPGIILSEKYIFIKKDNYNNNFIETNGPEFQVPFVDGLDDNVEFTKKSGLFLKRHITKSFSKNLLAEIEENSVMSLQSNLIGKSRWMNRGIMLRTICELFEIENAEDPIVKKSALTGKANILIEYIELKDKIDNILEQSWYYQKAISSHNKSLQSLQDNFQKFVDMFNKSTINVFLDEISNNNKCMAELERLEYLNWTNRKDFNSLQYRNKYLDNLIDLKKKTDVLQSLEYYAKEPKEFFNYL